MTIPTPETLRDRVAAAINDVLSCPFNEDEALDMADAALTAILASHEIGGRGESPAPARVSAGLSAEAIRTIRHALDDALDNVTEEYRHTNAIYREKYEAEDRAPILDAIAELAALTIPPITTDDKEAP